MVIFGHLLMIVRIAQAQQNGAPFPPGAAARPEEGSRGPQHPAAVPGSALHSGMGVTASSALPDIKRNLNPGLGSPPQFVIVFVGGNLQMTLLARGKLSPGC